jgi:hypothetical protein
MQFKDYAPARNIDLVLGRLLQSFWGLGFKGMGSWKNPYPLVIEPGNGKS